MKIQVIAPDNGLGLTRDSNIVSQLLREWGHTVVNTDSRSDKPQLRRGPYDLNLYLEVIHGRYFSTAPRHIVIPNPEWFMPQWNNSKNRFMAVWCKTNHALSVFRRRNFKGVRLIGFTAEDRSLPEITFEDKIEEFVHLPGGSGAKNTRRVIEVWNRWGDKLPKLNIYSRVDWSSLVQSPKISVNTSYLPDDEFKLIQNRYLYHLCPSSAEGFGHYIFEAASTGGLVLTTDAPPMNEVPRQFAWLCPPRIIGQHHWGQMWDTPPEMLYGRVAEMLAADKETKRKISKLGRLVFLQNKKQFTQAFKEAVDNVT